MIDSLVNSYNTIIIKDVNMYMYTHMYMYSNKESSKFTSTPRRTGRRVASKGKSHSDGEEGKPWRSVKRLLTHITSLALYEAQQGHVHLECERWDIHVHVHVYVHVHVHVNYLVQYPSPPGRTQFHKQRCRV